MSQNFPFPYLHASSNTAPAQPSLHNQPTHTSAMPPSNHATAPPPATQAQQAAAFLQNAQLSGRDLSVLQNISPEQMAVITQLIQAGLFPLPQAQNPAQPPPHVPASVQPSVAQQNGDMDLDKEEGEWEEDQVAPQAQPDFLRPPPTGPKKRSGSGHRNDNDKRVRHQPSPPRQPKGYDRRRPEHRPSDSISPPPQSPVHQRRAKHDAAKAFILAAYRAGFSFDDLAREVGDARMLKILFKELDLNVPSVGLPSTQEQPHAIASTRPAQTADDAPGKGTVPVNETATKPMVNRTPAPKVPATAPVDRSAYLARLQAAKNKKNEASPSATAAPPAAPPVEQTPSPAAVQQPKKPNIQTDLIRKRLEALKAEQALKEQTRKQEAERLANASAIAERLKGNDTPQPQSEIDSLSDSPGGDTVQHHQAFTPIQTGPSVSSPQNTIAPTQPVGFPGLPGLFMNGALSAAATPPAQVPAVSHSQQPLPTVPAPATQPSAGSSNPSRLTSARSSPHLTAKETALASEPKPVSSALQSGRVTPKHPFNQSRYDSNDDSVIIHVSDEEESELDDNMDEDEPAALAPAANPPTPASKPGPLRNFPAPSMSAAASPLVTPGATTPGDTAYQRKLQEIDEMHRRIAEMQKQAKKPKVNSKPPASVTPSLPADTTSVTTLPGLSSNTGGTPAAAPQPTEPVSSESSQQMEVKLAQLKEEAGMISEQRASEPAQNSESILPSQTPNANVSSAASSDEDDDDDAMDLSSGEDSDSESDSDSDGPAQTTHDDQPNQNQNQNQNQDQMEVDPVDIVQQEDSDTHDDSDSGSDDSTTDSDEESDEDYEPALAAPDAAVPNTAADEVAKPKVFPDRDITLLSQSSLSQPEHGPQDIDLAPEIQPLAGAEDKATPEEQAYPRSNYTPYESPLRMFRDYRFHPKFSSDVQGGFKSLTYSNKIDPTEFICSNELSEGTCHDADCTDQHFRNMAVSDADLLKDLGTRNAPWTTDEGENKWKAGLADIIQQLRASQQGSDVNAIAARIAQYRREFIGHPDQVLHLTRT